MIVAKCVLKRKILIVLFFFLSIVFIIVLIYQLKILDQLRYNTIIFSQTRSSNDEYTIRDIDKLLHNSKNNKFICIKSMEEIAIDHVNDNYCDCLDGSDEPRTNACVASVFYCNSQNPNFHNSIPSSRINDGICDCCDGSDEFDKEVKILDSIGYCPNRC
ncbi:hypothetical protein WA026_003695 [Henosepilachna vigintioctopunctata]|uniref:Glucosidase II beta subunit N-terminal domain-containing protein n=1 Tax=Henosepilachna vigintioctopunctata TaxID=420089 RepID=A0AAW1UCK0_9CUCU